MKKLFLILFIILYQFSFSHGDSFSEKFKKLKKINKPVLKIQYRRNFRKWKSGKNVTLTKNMKLSLRIKKDKATHIRWFQIIPDVSENYNNSGWPWEDNAYKWLGFAKIKYVKVELTEFRDKWEISPLEILRECKYIPEKIVGSDMYHTEAGSYWFMAEVIKNNKIYRTYGISDADKRGINPKVFRVTVRESNNLTGVLTGYFNVPGIFGSSTYQNANYIGADCADILVAAICEKRGKKNTKNYNVAMLVNMKKKRSKFTTLLGRPNKVIKWGVDVKPGDLIAVKYEDSNFYQHIGLVHSDYNSNGIFDGEDIVLHAGPYPLSYTQMKHEVFDGEIAILIP